MATAVMKGASVMERKTVSISSKRQITIPQKFFSCLGFTNEAECVLRGNELVIRPVKITGGGEFAEMILADLINQGLSGDKLLAEFKKAQAKIRPAVEELLSNAEKAASGDVEFATYEDVFHTEDNA